MNTASLKSFVFYLNQIVLNFNQLFHVSFVYKGDAQKIIIKFKKTL